MCGICGEITLSGGEAPLVSTVQAMNRAMRHRGPDGQGEYADEHLAMGSTRLAIIDLTGGQQPIHNEDQTIWIVFNGEIYNSPALRHQLERLGHAFYTHSDTEVIVHAYEEFGDECVRHLNGIFAFAIWDTRTRTLFVARDRVGVKPLFYTLTEPQPDLRLRAERPPDPPARRSQARPRLAGPVPHLRVRPGPALDRQGRQEAAAGPHPDRPGRPRRRRASTGTSAWSAARPAATRSPTTSVACSTSSRPPCRRSC